jgi:small-conductance mechanosensitive channel
MKRFLIYLQLVSLLLLVLAACSTNAPAPTPPAVVGARTILADVVGGFIILVGRPFRVGDAIKVEGGQDNQIRKLITDTLRGIDGVLPDKPVEILYREFGNSTRLIQVRWWIVTIDKEFYIVDTVNSAIEDALTNAGIEIPFTTLDLSLNQVVVSPAKTASGQEPESSDQDSA